MMGKFIYYEDVPKMAAELQDVDSLRVVDSDLYDLMQLDALSSPSS